MEKKLQVKEPLISCYTSYGTLFSLIPESCLPWIFENFIQLAYAKMWGMLVFDNHRLLLANCPGIDFFVFPYELCQKLFGNSIKDLIINIIDTKEYIYLYVDRYYISFDHQNYQKHHFLHEIFIYGYNMKKDVFYAADNFKTGKFMFVEIPCKEICQGFKNATSKYNFTSYFRVLRINNNQKYEMDIDKVKKLISEYIHNVPSFDIKKEQDMIYGIKVFDFLLELIHNNDYLDIRAYHLIYEHLILMELRMKYIYKISQNEEYISFEKQIGMIKDKAFILRNCVLKYNISHNQHTLSTIKQNLMELKQLEFHIFSNILNTL